MGASVLFRLVELGGAVLPQDRRIRTERRVRGWIENTRLRRADAAVVSYGKSGRTWVRVMLSRFYARKHELGDGAFLRFDEFRRKAPDVPAILFTHDNYLGDFTGQAQSKSDYRRHRLILLVRDPADVAVSQYFQWLHRMRPHKKLINGYPAHRAEVSMVEFVLGPAGIRKIIRFMNDWTDALPKLEAPLVVRYEDLRADPHRWLGEMLAILGTPGTEQEIADAVEYAAYENMRQREAVGDSGARALRAGNKANPDSFKARRAKVGGYRDYFDDAQIAQIDNMISRELSDQFGYADRKAPI